jgi:hypothetical protein
VSWWSEWSVWKVYSTIIVGFGWQVTTCPRPNVNGVVQRCRGRKCKASTQYDCGANHSYLYILKESSQTPRSTTTRLGNDANNPHLIKLVQTAYISPTATPTRTLIPGDPTIQHHFEIHSSSCKLLRSYYLRRLNQTVSINSTYHRERFGDESTWLFCIPPSKS